MSRTGSQSNKFGQIGCRLANFVFGYAGILFSLCAYSPCAVGQEVSEYGAKSAFVFNFLKLTEFHLTKECRAIFFGDATSRISASQLRGLSQSGILTIGEHEEFLSEGGLIRFFNEGLRVRFHVNQRLAEESGLKMSSKLLSLAVIYQSE